MYNNYSNLNIQLIDEYNLDLSLFYESLMVPNVKVDEIPIEKLQLSLDSMSVIIENTKLETAYFFDITNVKKFVELSTALILANIEELLENK